MTSRANDSCSRTGKRTGRAFATKLVHTRQLGRPLVWLEAFLSVTASELCRTLALTPPPSTPWLIVADASPWGFGAILYIHEEPYAWLAETLDARDETRFSASIGDRRAISTWGVSPF